MLVKYTTSSLYWNKKDRNMLLERLKNIKQIALGMPKIASGIVITIVLLTYITSCNDTPKDIKKSDSHDSIPSISSSSGVDISSSSVTNDLNSVPKTAIKNIEVHKTTGVSSKLENPKSIQISSSSSTIELPSVEERKKQIEKGVDIQNTECPSGNSREAIECRKNTLKKKWGL
jgi:predicted nucleic acid binding AN1-type Zn finger protein